MLNPTLLLFLGQPALAFLFASGYLGARFDFGTILGYDWLMPLNMELSQYYERKRVTPNY